MGLCPGLKSESAIFLSSPSVEWILLSGLCGSLSYFSIISYNPGGSSGGGVSRFFGESFNVCDGRKSGGTYSLTNCLISPSYSSFSTMYFYNNTCLYYTSNNLCFSSLFTSLAYYNYALKSFLGATNHFPVFISNLTPSSSTGKNVMRSHI